MFSNIHIGAEQPPRPSTAQQPSHLNRPNLIRGITDSTSNMTQFTAHFTALQLQEVPGVTYTLNPTAEAFEPEGDKSEEGNRRSED